MVEERGFYSGTHHLVGNILPSLLKMSTTRHIYGNYSTAQVNLVVRVIPSVSKP